MNKQDDIGAKVLSLVSHKLRTPLAIINGYSDAVILQKDKEKASPFTIKAVEEINKQGRALALLVDKLLLFGRVDAMRHAEVTKSQIDLRKVILDAVNSFMQNSPSGNPEKTVLMRGEDIYKDNFHIELCCLPGLQVMANEDLIRFAIYEIIDNAIKFNKNQEKNLKIYCNKNNNGVSVSIKDNGIGIKPGEINNIFERFYQVDEYFTGQVEGWGLGLPFVKKVLALHDGTISVVSDTGIGSVFTITLPL